MVLSGGNLPLGEVQQEAFTRSGDDCRRGDFVVFSVQQRGGLLHNLRVEEHCCWRTGCCGVGAAPLNSLLPSSTNIIYVPIFIYRKLFCGSVGTRIQQGVHVKGAAGLGCLHKSVPVPKEPMYSS